MEYKPTAELSFEISELNITIDELTEYVHRRYGKHWKFNRTEHRYLSCVMAIYEEVDYEVAI